MGDDDLPTGKRSSGPASPRIDGEQPDAEATLGAGPPRTSGSVPETAIPPSASARAERVARWKGTPSADHPDLVEVDACHYELGPEIGGGGMGRIRVARDRRLGRLVALKLLRPGYESLADRFEREARITSRLQHPSIVNVHEAGRRPSGEPFYAMRLVHGQRLDAVLDRIESVYRLVLARQASPAQIPILAEPS